MKNEKVADDLQKKYPIPDYAKFGHSCVGMSEAKFDQWYEETFKLENEDTSIQNPYRVKAKLNKKEKDSLPQIFPLKGRKEASIEEEEESSKSRVKQASL